MKKQFLLKWEFWLLTSQYMHTMPKIIINIINYYLKIILLVCIIWKNILYFEFEINVIRELKIDNPFLISINSLILTIDDATSAIRSLTISIQYIYLFLYFSNYYIFFTNKNNKKLIFRNIKKLNLKFFLNIPFKKENNDIKHNQWIYV